MLDFPVMSRAKILSWATAFGIGLSLAGQASAAELPLDCAACTPEQADALRAKLSAWVAASPELDGTPVRIALTSELPNGGWSRQGVSIQVRAIPGAADLHPMVAHELGHGLFYRRSVQAGMGELEDAVLEVLEKGESGFRKPVFKAIRGSCREAYQLAGLRRAFHELAADVFAYFALDRHPTALADGVRAVTGVESDVRRFDSELPDATIRSRLLGYDHNVFMEPYAALSQVKRSVHESAALDAGTAMDLLARQYRVEWESGCGKSTFQQIRERIRAALVQQSAN